jgi:hypothetical protein
MLCAKRGNLITDCILVREWVDVVYVVCHLRNSSDMLSAFVDYNQDVSWSAYLIYSIMLSCLFALDMISVCSDRITWYFANVLNILCI